MAYESVDRVLAIVVCPLKLLLECVVLVAVLLTPGAAIRAFAVADDGAVVCVVA